MEDEKCHIFIHHQKEAYLLLSKAAECRKLTDQGLPFHDRLTGLYNRAFFEEEINRLNSSRQLPISLIFADLDYLRLINDALGHEEGDRFLQMTAQVLKSSCRQEDIITRWGGDEFVILLPQTPFSTARSVGQRITQQSQAIKAKPVPLCLSLGIATKEREEQCIKEVMAKAEEAMYHQKTMKDSKTQDFILSSLKKTIREIYQATGNHLNSFLYIRLHQLAGKALGLSEEQLEQLYLLATFHDIGKVGLPLEILRKNNTLSPEEWKKVKLIPEIGYRIARSLSHLAAIAPTIFSYYERWDGTGYPRGLREQEIPLLSRISSLINAYCAMLTQRPYAPAKSPAEAEKEIILNSGQQFDPELVKLFVELNPSTLFSQNLLRDNLQAR